jgi:hypothetical protein
VLVPTNTKLTHVFGSKVLVLVLVYYKLILTPPSGVHQSNTNFHLLEVLIFLVLVPTNTKLTHVFGSKMLVYYKLILTPPSKHDQGCIRVDAIASKRCWGSWSSEASPLSAHACIQFRSREKTLRCMSTNETLMLLMPYEFCCAGKAF